jgi:DNA-binding response OmpR family regulator
MTRPPLARILHVEDEPDIQEVARLALEMVGGFTVLSCDSGRKALSAAAEFRPDLILLDVMMPGMDGPTTLAELRKAPATAATPVVFMTAKVQTHEVARLKELGAADVIEKPFDPMTLAERVNAIWNGLG